MKNIVLKNWKTTAAGLLTVLLTGVSITYPEYAPLCAKVGALAVGLGFVAAKDGNVTGGTSQQ